MQTRMLQQCELMCKLVKSKGNTASGCHLYKLDGDGNVSYVAPKLKDSKGGDITNKLFQDRSSFMWSHHLVHCP